jgi:hypothetical protein
VDKDPEFARRIGSSAIERYKIKEDRDSHQRRRIFITI